MSKIDHAAELEAIDGWRAGDSLAGARLLAMHKGLIRLAVARYRLTRCPLEDLLQVGAMAMLRAAHGWEADRGITFATYSRRAMANAALPYRHRTTADIAGCDDAHKAASSLLDTRPNRKPPSQAVLDVIRCNPFTLLQLQRPAVRLDSPDATHSDLLASNDLAADDALQARQERANLDAMLSELSTIEREIVYRRYLADQTETLEEIGFSKGKSRERMRQIEAKALATMRRRVEREEARSAC